MAVIAARPTCPIQGSASNRWQQVRGEEALTPDGIVRQAEAATERYGFAD
jgi:glucarate dehydratase